MWQYIGDFLFERQRLIENGGFYDLPYAWASDDITAIRAALQKGIANCNRPGFLYRVNNQTISMSTDERGKAMATLKEREWFDKVISISNPTDNVDKILLLSINKSFNNYFISKFMLNVKCDISSNVLRTTYWFFNRKKFYLSYKNILRVFLKVCLSRIGSLI